MTLDDVIMALEWLGALKKDPSNPENVIIEFDRLKMQAQVDAENAKPNLLRAKMEYLQWTPFDYGQVE